MDAGKGEKGRGETAKLRIEEGGGGGRVSTFTCFCVGKRGFCGE